MLLTRFGNKKKIAHEIYPHFPPHHMRITLFFGAGGIFFNTPKSKYNILNDLDDDITNLYFVVTNWADQLIEEIKLVPISKLMVDHFKSIPAPEDPIKKAVRFLMLSNFTYLGKGNTLRFGVGNEKAILITNIKKTLKSLGETKIMNEDFREVIPKISFRGKDKGNAFIYLDPVYLDTAHNYKVPSWTKDHTYDCFEIMESYGIKAAMSEFDHPFVIEQAKKRNFNIIPIKNRRNLKNRRLEILITNYEMNRLFV